MSQNEVVGGLADGKSEDQSFFLKEMIAELTKAKKCREYTNARLREFPRKTNRRDFRRANADRFTSVKSVVAAKKNLLYGAADPSPTPELGPIRMPLKVTAVDSPTNLAQERHWAMIRALENPARDERQSCFRTYLALNWQRRRIKTRFKWIEQRFPTPPQRRNNGEIDQLLTTNHLFWPNERRKAASSLPFWLPNPTLPAAKCNPSKPRGGAGDQLVVFAKRPRPKSSHGILLLLVPCPIPVALKKNALRTADQFRAVCTRTFT